MDPVAWASQASKRRRVYELNGVESRTPVAVGTFRVVPEQDLDPSESKRQEGPGLMHDLEDLTVMSAAAMDRRALNAFTAAPSRS